MVHFVTFQTVVMEDGETGVLVPNDLLHRKTSCPAVLRRAVPADRLKLPLFGFFFL